MERVSRTECVTYYAEVVPVAGRDYFCGNGILVSRQPLQPNSTHSIICASVLMVAVHISPMHTPITEATARNAVAIISSQPMILICIPPSYPDQARAQRKSPAGLAGLLNAVTFGCNEQAKPARADE
jgi:hypothetical protein